MSKTKTKEKKSQSHEALQRQYQQQRRQLLDVTFTLRKVQQRVNILTLQNNRLQKERQSQYLIMNDKIEQLTIKNENNQKRLMNMRTNLTTAQVQNKKLINSMALLQKNTNDERAQRIKELDQLKKNHSFEVAKYQNQLSDYKYCKSVEESNSNYIKELIEARQLQIANRIREVADKQRQKIHATDKIRDQMSNKIRDMRQNLLSLKKEELQTTTRLTMLQNHQLTSQLQYQSKQTEKLVFKNQELQATVLKLKQELEIHKQVQQQLAKRSHFSKGIIKKLHLRVAELQQDLQGQKQTLKEQIQQKQMNQTMKSQKNERSMIQAIEKQLQRSQKKNAQLISQCEQLRKQKDDYHSKWLSWQTSKNELSNLLLKCYRDVLGEEKEQGPDRYANLVVLRQKKVQEWCTQQRITVMSILLAACQPYLNKSNLTIPSLRKIIVCDSENKAPSFPKISTQRAKQMQAYSSQSQINTNQDVCFQAKEQLSKEKYKTNIASRMVIGRVRDWGKAIPNSSKASLQRKYKLSVSYRN